MKEISLHDIWRAIRNKWIVIVAITLCVGLIALLFTAFLVSPQYQSTASLYVYSSEKGNQNYSDLNYSKSLVPTYLVIIESETVLSRVAEGLKEKYPDLTADGIRRMLKGGDINETEAFSISITSDNPTMSLDICNQIVKIAPAEIVRIAKAGSVEVIDYPKLPTDAYHPIMRNTVLGLLIGLILAVVGTVVFQITDNKIYTRKDLAGHFKAPVLGAIPDFSSGSRDKKSKKSLHEDSQYDRELLLKETTPFAVTEAYRMLRTNITYLPTEKHCKSIAVTSAVVGEGKTTVSCNLAITLANKGAKVALIDADMRMPRISKLLKTDSKVGLSEFIAGISDGIPIQTTAYDNLYVITSGKTSDTSAELLSSPRMASLIRACETEFDYIILDTPPLTLMTDAATLANAVDGYIMVSFAEYSTVPAIQEAMDSLQQLDAKVFGFVLVGIHPKSDGRYDQYGMENDAYGHALSDAASHGKPAHGMNVQE